MPRVTNAIDLLSSPYLNRWYSDMGTKKALFVLDLIKQTMPHNYGPIKERLNEQFFTTAQDKKQEYADIGSYVHKMIATHLSGKPLTTVKNEAINNSFKNFLQWKLEHKIKVKKLEFIVYSKKHKVAGTADALLQVDGKLGLYDWKTGAQCIGALAQISAYRKMCAEMKIRGIQEVKIVYFDRKKKFKESRDVVNVPKKNILPNFKIFLGLMNAWKWMNAK